MQNNTYGVLTYSDKTTSRAIFLEKETTAGVVSYWFTYPEEEPNKRIKHDKFGDKFPIPEAIALKVFVPDTEVEEVIEDVLEKEIEYEDEDDYDKKNELLVWC